MSEEIEAEEKARAASEAEKKSMPELPSPEEMPRAPEPLPTPSSLGGLADRAGVEVPDEGETSESEDELKGLRERTEEVSETIGEHSDAREDNEEPKIQPGIGTKERAL